MSEILSELRYTKTHEWVRRESDNSITVGITDHAQQLLGEVVYVELPEVEMEMKAGDDSGVIESVKAASDFYAPASGEIIAINEDLNDSPDLINSDPYGGGWIIQMRLVDEGEWEDLLTADDYEELLTEEEH